MSEANGGEKNDLRFWSACASHQPVSRPSGGGGAFNLGRRIPSRRLFEVCAGTGLKSEPLAVGGSHKSNAGVQRSAGLQAAGSAVTCGH